VHGPKLNEVLKVSTSATNASWHADIRAIHRWLHQWRSVATHTTLLRCVMWSGKSVTQRDKNKKPIELSRARSKAQSLWL